MKTIPRSCPTIRTVVLAGLPLIAGVAGAQDLDGLWGSSLYQVQLKVNGTSVTGTFTSLAHPQAPAGALTGQLQREGQAFTAEWAFHLGADTGTFKTWLSYQAKGSLLEGVRWTEGSFPTSFSLHRAVNGQVPAFPGEDDLGVPAPPPANNQVELVTCDNVAGDQPQNPGTEFVAPKNIYAFVRFTNLPANTALDWVWMRDGREEEARLSKTFSGSGMHCHLLHSETTISPGTLQLTVSLNGKVVAQRTLTVRPAGSATPSTSPYLPLTVDFKGPGDTVAVKLPQGYPRTAVRIELTVNYTAPGSILDTVGLNAAPVGAWTLVVTPDGRISMNLFDPGRQSPRRAPSGWHLLASKPVAARVDHHVRVDHSGTEVILTVDGATERVALATPLSGQPVFIGDFPGDASWAPRLQTKLGMTGRVILRMFGALPGTAK